MRRVGTAELRAAADEEAAFSDQDVLGARTSAWFVEGIDAERSLDAQKSSDSLPQMYARLAGAEAEADSAAPRSRFARSSTLIAVFVVAGGLIAAALAVFLAR